MQNGLLGVIPLLIMVSLIRTSAESEIRNLEHWPERTALLCSIGLGEAERVIRAGRLFKVLMFVCKYDQMI